MFSRRDILRALAGVPGLSARSRAETAATLSHRLLGRTGRFVTPLGLGGQASLQWTGAGIDPADIIARAVELGVNYLDSANAYGPSQANYGEAFRRLSLVPGQPGYNAALRESLYIASKTGVRYARNPVSSSPSAVQELRTSLTMMFGDGEGHIPEGAYLDAIQIHNLTSAQQVDQIYESLADRDSRMPERVGALAGLLDFRDGTNYTGLNPERRHWVRHIGITGHQDSRVLINALQRDELNIIDTMLVALNANDRRYAAHQYNAVPVALARGLGIIAMKSFADGVFYGKPARFSNNAGDVVLSVGRPGAIACSDLVRYPLSVAGVSCVITGIGRIDRDNAENDQLAANLGAALSDPASAVERRRIEDEAAQRHGPDTNYFQSRYGLVEPSGVKVEASGDRVWIRWNTALAGSEPIRSYRIWAGDKLLLALPFRPQITTAPLSVSLPAAEIGDGAVRVEASVEPPA